MRRKDYLALFFIALLVQTGAAWFQHSPGFMDAEYYFIGGQALVRGEGFYEQILWNYLDDPAGLPHPSHGYWMPMAPIFAALGMRLSGSSGFEQAQWIFVLIGSLFPPLTAALGFSLTHSRLSARISGGLAVFSGFYLPFLTTTETFGIYAVLGALFFILLSYQHQNNIPPALTKWSAAPFYVLLGLIAGLMHLTRAEGVLWLGFTWLGAALSTFRLSENAPEPEKSRVRTFLTRMGLALAGYTLVMLPWFWRNWQAFGAPLAPGGSRALWLTRYNELFIYPASTLTFQRWWASGLNAILDARLWALGQNLQRALAEQGMIFLAPLILAGIWTRRGDFRIQMAALIWLANLALMTLIFPYQGARGGFFHTSAALLPILWALAPVGLERALSWASSRRKWNINEARAVFSGALLIFAALLTVFTASAKFRGKDGAPPVWERNRITYQSLEAELSAFTRAPDEMTMVVNPPAYLAHTQRSAVAIPDGTSVTVLEVAARYGARYLLLEESHPDGLDALYQNPQAAPSGLTYLATVEGTHIFRVEN